MFPPGNVRPACAASVLETKSLLIIYNTSKIRGNTIQKIG